MAAASRCGCASRTAAPLHPHRPVAAPAAAGAAHQCVQGLRCRQRLGRQLAGSFAGHGRKLVSDAAQPVQHSVQRFLTQLHGDGRDEGFIPTQAGVFLDLKREHGPQVSHLTSRRPPGEPWARGPHAIQGTAEERLFAQSRRQTALTLASLGNQRRKETPQRLEVSFQSQQALRAGTREARLTPAPSGSQVRKHHVLVLPVYAGAPGVQKNPVGCRQKTAVG